MKYWWLITKWDGTTRKVKPEHVDVVNRHMKSGEPIETATGTIVIKDIKSFDQTDTVYSEVKELSNGAEEASRAFKEPVETDEGILSRAVKKRVTRKNWETRYSRVPGYVLLKDDTDMIVVGIWMPSHLIDYNLVEACKPEEEAILIKGH